jgi:hypothetical protein
MIEAQSLRQLLSPARRDWRRRRPFTDEVIKSACLVGADPL